MSEYLAACFPVAVQETHHVQTADYSPRGLHYPPMRFPEPTEPPVIPASPEAAKRAIKVALAVVEELGPEPTAQPAPS